jgi:membrane-associated phospholipid phosphatase
LVAIVLLVRRDAAIVNFTGGAILNALLGKTLKRIIKEARPDGAVLEDPGMPSSHAMALFYMTSFITAALCESKGLGGALPPWWPLQYTTTIFSVVLYVLTASSWRVFSGLHTPAQIVVGAGVGSGVGVAWQYVCRTRVNGEVGRWLLARFEGGQVPLSYLVGVMVVGALTVGSVERKISKAMRRILHDGRKEEGTVTGEMEEQRQKMN